MLNKSRIDLVDHGAKAILDRYDEKEDEHPIHVVVITVKYPTLDGVCNDELERTAVRSGVRTIYKSFRELPVGRANDVNARKQIALMIAITLVT